MKTLLLVLLLSCSVCAQEARVIKKESWLRKSPSSDASAIVSVKINTKLKLLTPDHIGGWYKVTALHSKRTGWIHGNDISLADDIISDLKKKYGIRGNDKWIYVTSASSSHFYYNPSRITRFGGGLRAWIKETDRTSARTLSMEQLEFQCNHSRYRSLANTEYNANGQSIRSWDQPNARFIAIVPETTTERIYETLCSTH